MHIVLPQLGDARAGWYPWEAITSLSPSGAALSGLKRCAYSYCNLKCQTWFILMGNLPFMEKGRGVGWGGWEGGTWRRGHRRCKVKKYLNLKRGKQITLNAGKDAEKSKLLCTGDRDANLSRKSNISREISIEVTQKSGSTVWPRLTPEGL